MEELRLGKIKELSEMEILINQLRKKIILEISEQSLEFLEEIKGFAGKV